MMRFLKRTIAGKFWKVKDSLLGGNYRICESDILIPKNDLRLMWKRFKGEGDDMVNDEILEGKFGK